eukprot:3679745-Amphidinium_carterae.1
MAPSNSVAVSEFKRASIHDNVQLSWRASKSHSLERVCDLQSPLGGVKVFAQVQGAKEKNCQIILQ